MILSKKKILEKAIIVIFLVLFFFVTTKIKVPGVEALRPFYIYGLVLSFFIIMICVFFNSLSLYLIYTLLRREISLLFGILLFYFTISALVINYEIPNRQIKDQMYFLFWIVIFPLFPFFLVSRKIDITRVIYLLSKSIIIFGVVSAILSFLLVLNLITINFGDLEIIQQPYLRSRIHGTLGEPTSLSQLLGISILSLFFLKRLSGQSQKILISFLLISIVSTGSRNAILSLFAVFFVSLMFEPKRYKINFKVFIYSFVLVLILMIILLGTDKIFVIESLFLNRPTFDLDNKYSRLVIWSKVIKLITESNFFELLLGHGAFELRRVFGAAFNTPLEILYDYGVIICITFLFSFFLSLYSAIRKYQKTKFYIYKYGAYFLTFGFTFVFFMSYFPTSMFQFSVFAIVLGFWICAIPINYLDRNTTQNKSTNFIN